MHLLHLEEISMRKTRSFFTVFLAAVLLMISSVAFAAQVTPVPAGRIQDVRLPAGVVTRGNPTISDGLVTVYVDDDATDWTEVLRSNASRDILCVSLKLTAPSGMTKGTHENFSEPDSAEIISGTVPDWFAEYTPENLSDGRTISGESVFAEIQMGQPAMLEFAYTIGSGTLVCWGNESGDRAYEYVQWRIIHSNAAAREVLVPQVTEKALSSIPAHLPSGITAEVELGGVTCIVNNFNGLSSIPLVISAPAGADSAVLTYTGDEELESVYLPVSAGKVTVSITRGSHPTFASNGIQPAQIDFVIDFFSDDDLETPLSGSGIFSVWLLAKEQAPYPYYHHPDNAQPVDRQRLSVFQGDQPVSTDGLYRETYGHVHLSSTGLDVTANPSGIIRMEVTPPDWAVAYGLQQSGGDFIFRTDWGIGASSEKHAIQPGGTVRIYDDPLFRLVQAGRTLVYLRNGITARYGGYVRVISWYDSLNAEKPRLIEYISITQEEFSVEVRNALIGSEDALRSPVTEVTGISGQDWELVVRHDPQIGEDAIHYDLHVEDTSGIPRELGEETVFYIPYPDGYAYGDESVEYVLYHYSSTYQSFVEVQLEPTPYGLRFVEDHLSPFVLMWNAAQSPVSAADLPQTGDHTPPVVWLLLMLAVSLASLVCVMRRRRI